jgi:hypothetical protein
MSTISESTRNVVCAGAYKTDIENAAINRFNGFNKASMEVGALPTVS